MKKYDLNLEGVEFVRRNENKKYHESTYLFKAPKEILNNCLDFFEEDISDVDYILISMFMGEYCYEPGDEITEIVLIRGEEPETYKWDDWKKIKLSDKTVLGLSKIERLDYEKTVENAIETPKKETLEQINIVDKSNSEIRSFALELSKVSQMLLELTDKCDKLTSENKLVLEENKTLKEKLKAAENKNSAILKLLEA